MKPAEKTFDELFNEERKLTFLIGAGCSIDPPSCLPAGKKMMEAIIKFSCGESEIENILNLSNLRFEQLVEVVREHLDSDLKLIDYYGKCDKPNRQHLFIAEMLLKGHFVITTNFDYLIEHALLQLDVPKENIVPVITKRDFLKYNNPQKLSKKGKKAVYKIHGSPQNIITGENTKDSLVATIKAFGSNKEGLNVFQLQSFQEKAFKALTTDRTVVVMGYSGSDDFDVIPTLKELMGEYLIWINHIPDDSVPIKILQPDDNDKNSADKIISLLYDLLESFYECYRIEANTSKFIGKLAKQSLIISSDHFTLEAFNWLMDSIKKPDEIMKYHLSYQIYKLFERTEDQIRCLENILHISEEKEEKYWRSFAFHGIGDIYYGRYQISEASDKYNKALAIVEEINSLPLKAEILKSIAEIDCAYHKFDDALKKYGEVIQIHEKLGLHRLKAEDLCLMGALYIEMNERNKANEKYTMALELAEKNGDLPIKIKCLIGFSKRSLSEGKIEKSLQQLEEALNIAEELNRKIDQIEILNSMGSTYIEKRYYGQALGYFQKAFDIAKESNRRWQMGVSLVMIGVIFMHRKEYSIALENLNEALKIAEDLGDLGVEQQSGYYIGQIYLEQGKYPEALEKFEKDLEIKEWLKMEGDELSTYDSMGQVYRSQKKYSEAAEIFEKALKIAKTHGTFRQIAIILNHLGETHGLLGNKSEASNFIKEGIKIIKDNKVEDPAFIRKCKTNLKNLKEKEFKLLSEKK
jgi:tetratricopeptide (TPR) repeat protein